MTGRTENRLQRHNFELRFALEEMETGQNLFISKALKPINFHLKKKKIQNLQHTSS